MANYVLQSAKEHQRGRVLFDAVKIKKPKDISTLFVNPGNFKTVIIIFTLVVK